WDAPTTAWRWNRPARHLSNGERLGRFLSLRDATLCGHPPGDHVGFFEGRPANATGESLHLAVDEPVNERGDPAGLVRLDLFHPRQVHRLQTGTIVQNGCCRARAAVVGQIRA